MDVPFRDDSEMCCAGTIADCISTHIVNMYHEISVNTVLPNGTGYQEKNQRFIGFYPCNSSRSNKIDWTRVLFMLMEFR